MAPSPPSPSSHSGVTTSSLPHASRGFCASLSRGSVGDALMAARISSRMATVTPVQRLSGDLFLSRSDPVVFSLGAMGGGLNTATATSARLLPHIVFFSLPPCHRRSISCTASPDQDDHGGCLAGVSDSVAQKLSGYQRIEKRRLLLKMIILDVPSVWGRLMLVDMAGSEDIEAAGQTGFEAKMQEGSGLCSFVHRHVVRAQRLREEPHHVRLRQAARDRVPGARGYTTGGRRRKRRRRGGVSGAGGEGDGRGEDDAGFGMGLFVQVAVLKIYNEEIYDLICSWGEDRLLKETPPSEFCLSIVKIYNEEIYDLICSWGADRLLKETPPRAIYSWLHFFGVLQPLHA